MCVVAYKDILRELVRYPLLEIYGGMDLCEFGRCWRESSVYYRLTHLHDDKACTFGGNGDHNVVIAYLPNKFMAQGLLY